MIIMHMRIVIIDLLTHPDLLKKYAENCQPDL